MKRIYKYEFSFPFVTCQGFQIEVYVRANALDIIEKIYYRKFRRHCILQTLSQADYGLVMGIAWQELRQYAGHIGYINPTAVA